MHTFSGGDDEWEDVSSNESIGDGDLTEGEVEMEEQPVSLFSWMKAGI